MSAPLVGGPFAAASSPAPAVGPWSSVAALFVEQAERHRGDVAFRELVAAGGSADGVLTWGDWLVGARRFAAALVARGVAPGDCVAVLAGNGREWPIADLGALLAGAVGVGVYPTSAPPQVAEVLEDCAASVLVVDTTERAERVAAVREQLPRLRLVVAPAPAGAGETVAWNTFLKAGRMALEDSSVAAEVERRIAAARPEDLALLIYTSGSTGMPKGARITHRYLLASAASIRDTLGLQPTDTELSALPFCHAAERIFGMYTRILVGMEALLVPDHTRLWDAARAYGPTVFGGLPHFYEKAYEALRAAETADGEEASRWRRTLELGRVLSRARRGLEPLRSPDELLAVEAEWAEVGEPLFSQLRDLFGGGIRVATSGGAALPEEVAEYLDALGLRVLGAYGLTEHLCVAMNRADRYGFDTAGPPMPGTALRVAADGEVQIRRSALTFDGYRGRPLDTAVAFTPDGEWLLTGDLGSLDERGFLRITGRKKELIALSTGKKVAPLPIEARLTEQPLISQAVLYGEGRKFISALLTLRRQVLDPWARAQGLDPADPGLLEHPVLRAAVQAAVDVVNAGLSRPERVKRFFLLDRELSTDRDELTPTLKVRRDVVCTRFGAELDALYDGGES
ncbi:MAG: AMP-binding protein [Gemmatimonadetes bacterium]|nr:AMP-binding protein [Gemmatimonadota bacterium]